VLSKNSENDSPAVRGGLDFWPKPARVWGSER